ncbi:uncharacterized protein TNCV_2175961 [Trichonephila clavipes]|uniref:Uncharacterized protein n=1 Tax=Trichonephila clavipes TaxID=2585209 RepID=A0A8X6VG96_TRICX|nr:uncharacterized protein TNCV_2175961 [Trichonephila clavipes]
MISSFINDNHETWGQFLREFTYALRTAVHETTGKTPAELFLGRKLITSFQKLVMVSDGAEFASVLSVGNNNVVIWKAKRRTTVNIDQVRIYYQRKSDEGVIEVESSVSRGSEYQSSSLEENRPILDQSKGLRSSESGERRGEQGKNTSLTGNQGGGEALTINIDSPNNRVANSQSKVKGAEDPVLIFLDTPNKVANSSLRSGRSVFNIPGQSRQYRQQDRQEHKNSPTIRRSESLEVHIGYVKERSFSQTEDYDLPSAMEFLKNHKDFFKDLRLGTALNEMLCDAREFADEIDIPANFELTPPRHRVRRRNLNFD